MNLNRFQVFAALILACSGPVSGQSHSIDTAKSSMTVHVYKTGVLSAFGHDHEISAPLASGSVDIQGRARVARRRRHVLRVQDPKVSDKDRAEIQTNTMLGPEVLDAQNQKEIRFQSTSAEPAAYA